MPFTVSFFALVLDIQKDPSSMGICMKSLFQNVKDEKARQPALGVHNTFKEITVWVTISTRK